MRNRSIEPDELQCFDLEGSVNVFSVLGVDITIPLKLAALQSVFDSSTAPIHSSPKYYTPAELNPKVINYPNQNNPSIDFSNVVPPDGLLADALVQLERYGSFVSTSANSQLPLYDQFKTAAALHDCLINGVGQEKCVLVACDFSGIQDTVYTITSKGALKTLRARSFMLELLCEHLIYEILHIAHSDRHAVIYSGGGGFSLLLPNLEKLPDSDGGITEKINEYRETINKWALKEFEGRLFIALDAKPFDKEKLRDQASFQEIRQSQADALDRLKRRKFSDHLETLFNPSMPEQVTVKKECQITHRDDLTDDEMFDLNEPNRCVSMASVDADKRDSDDYLWVSESCYHQFKLGDKLVGATGIFRYTTAIDRSKNPGTLVLPSASGGMVSYTVEEVADATPETQWSINSWDGQRLFLYANYVRKHGELSAYARQEEKEQLLEEGRQSVNSEDTASFEGLASSSCGADLIGALRMDVDNLGKLFSSISNIAQLSARSRMLNLFFKLHLNHICANRSFDLLKKNKAEHEEWGKPGRNVSIIYAGGDDLFIVGAWDETVELAFDIQKEFECFTAALPKGANGISGGLTLHQPKFPLYQMARLSAEAEAYAKGDRDDGELKPKKNRISLFYDHSKVNRKMRLGNVERSRYMLSMEWALAKTFLWPLMEMYQRCFKHTEFQSETRKSIEIEYFSYSTIEKWFAVIKKYQQSNQLYLPTMARVMKDVEREFSDDDKATLFKNLVSYLYTTEESKRNWISHLHIALNWLTYLRRKV
ncbi:MAG: type III-A CRISPR-associated protein Cas10/Csm1 [Chlorobiaceae bacterium]|nr:type III-A CRISPR-associated protein Cas10/Csm1 [Chlorobiaceae bacterium]